MAVRRIVCSVATRDPAGRAAVYRTAVGRDLAMDMGWIVTLSGGAQGAQRNLASQRGSGPELPAIPIEADDLDAALVRSEAPGRRPVSGPVDDPSGARRFHLRDPGGTRPDVLVPADPNPA